MKYELTNHSIKYFDKTLYRIRALKDFSNVHKGDLGGYIERVENLSQTGNCWIYNNARVFDNALVCDNAKVYNNALVCENALVYGNAKVYGDVYVQGNARVGAEDVVSGNADVKEIISPPPPKIINAIMGLEVNE